MKRYLYFQTPNSDFDLQTPLFILCGNPRTVALNPTSNAVTFLWEQIQPDPTLNPVSITPNNTTKNVIVIIPNSITTKIILRVTINGDINNFRLVEINPLLLDVAIGFSKGTSLLTNNNTLNDPISLLLAPYPLSGPQVIQYTNNTQLTGIRLNGQSYTYRNTFALVIDVVEPNNNIITVPVFRAIDDFITEDVRLNFRVNTNYTFIKKWADIKVLSQTLQGSNQQITISYPTYIADDYAKGFSKGSSLLSFVRIPFTIQNISEIDNINSGNFSKGSSLLSFNRIPFTVQNISEIDNINGGNFSKGSSLLSFIRTSLTATIVG